MVQVGIQPGRWSAELSELMGDGGRGCSGPPPDKMQMMKNTVLLIKRGHIFQCPSVSPNCWNLSDSFRGLWYRTRDSVRGHSWVQAWEPAWAVFKSFLLVGWTSVLSSPYLAVTVLYLNLGASLVNWRVDIWTWRQETGIKGTNFMAEKITLLKGLNK